MTKEMQAIRDQVSRIPTVKESVIALFKKLIDRITQVQNDPAEVQRTADEAKAALDEMAAAVVEHTPAENL